MYTTALFRGESCKVNTTSFLRIMHDSTDTGFWISCVSMKLAIIMISILSDLSYPLYLESRYCQTRSMQALVDSVTSHTDLSIHCTHIPFFVYVP